MAMLLLTTCCYSYALASCPTPFFSFRDGPRPPRPVQSESQPGGVALLSACASGRRMHSKRPRALVALSSSALSYNLAYMLAHLRLLALTNPHTHAANLTMSKLYYYERHAQHVGVPQVGGWVDAFLVVGKGGKEVGLWPLFAALHPSIWQIVSWVPQVGGCVLLESPLMLLVTARGVTAIRNSLWQCVTEWSPL